MYENASSTAFSCAASSAADTVSSAMANRTLTLFGAENVTSKPGVTVTDGMLVPAPDCAM